MEVPVQYQIAGKTAREIATSVEAGVRTGRLSPGQPVPTIRDLAGELGVSPATVAAAYRDLRSWGLVLGDGRRGTRVRGQPPVAGPAPPRLPPGVRNLASGNPDPALLPPIPAFGADPPALAPRQGARRSGNGRLYGEPAVHPHLRDLAAEQLAADGVDPMHLAVVSGALDGVERALGAGLRPGELVAVEDPCYPPVLDLLAAMGLEPLPVPVDATGLRPEALARSLAAGATAVVATPRAQNPTGAAWTRRRAADLTRVLRPFPDVLVVEDDHAGPIAGAPAHTLGRGRGRWATVRSVCKSLGPDLRLAVLAGDPTTVARVEGRQALGPGWVSHVLQGLVADLWSDPATGPRLEAATTTYARRRRALLRALSDRGIPATGRSGLNVWVPVRSEHAVVAGLLEAGWGVAPGERFRLASPPGVRISVGRLEPGEAGRLAADLAACLGRRGARLA